MSRRSKIFLIVVLAIILILALVLIIFERGRAPTGTGTETTPTGTTSRPPPLPGLPTPTVIEPPPPGPVEQNPEAIAMDFTERYGSYSNQGDYQNLRDLFPQMTTGLRARTESFIASNPLGTGDYSGVTTRALSLEVLSRTDTNATMTVSTQRQEATETNQAARIYYQTARLTLVKSGLKWLVDSFEWQ